MSSLELLRASIEEANEKVVEADRKLIAELQAKIDTCEVIINHSPRLKADGSNVAALVLAQQQAITANSEAAVYQAMIDDVEDRISNTLVRLGDKIGLITRAYVACKVLKEEILAAHYGFNNVVTPTQRELFMAQLAALERHLDGCDEALADRLLAEAYEVKPVASVLELLD
jgi:ribosome-associated translation inhibitor RaiA